MVLSEASLQSRCGEHSLENLSLLKNELKKLYARSLSRHTCTWRNSLVTHANLKVVANGSLEGCGGHLDLHVKSKKFAGLNQVQQHQLVYSALGDDVGNYHSISLKTESA